MLGTRYFADSTLGARYVIFPALIYIFLGIMQNPELSYLMIGKPRNSENSMQVLSFFLKNKVILVRQYSFL